MEVVYIVTLIDINKAIVAQVKEGLKGTTYENIAFSSTDIVENITRPSFYINFLNSKTNLMLQNSKERNVELELFYFAKNRTNTKLEVLDMQDLLSDIFITSLKVTEDFYISIYGCEFDVNKIDGYLTLSLELYILEELEEEGTELLEELETSMKIN